MCSPARSKTSRPGHDLASSRSTVSVCRIGCCALGGPKTDPPRRCPSYLKAMIPGAISGKPSGLRGRGLLGGSSNNPRQRKEVLRRARGLLRQGEEEGRDPGPEAGDHEERPPGDPRDLPRLRDE